MAERAVDVRDWLNRALAIDSEATVGVDEGGLCLQIPETGAYYEIGGFPVDDDDEDDDDESGDGCYYGDPSVCRGELWMCETCEQNYCEQHSHSTTKGVDVECLACEQRRLEKAEEESEKE